jgi:hypothetical protein
MLGRLRNDRVALIYADFRSHAGHCAQGVERRSRFAAGLSPIDQQMLPTRVRDVEPIAVQIHKRVIGSPVRDCAHARDTAAFRSTVKTLPLTLTPAAVARLDDAATEFLHHHAVHDEPLRWHPKPDLFGVCGLRSPTADLPTVRRLLEDGRRFTLTAIAAQAGVPLEHLHYLIGEADPPLPQHPSAPPSVVRCAGLTVLSQAQLMDLYEGQQLGLARIGQMYGVSRHTVTHIARRYGVALRRPGRPLGS